MHWGCFADAAIRVVVAHVAGRDEAALERELFGVEAARIDEAAWPLRVARAAASGCTASNVPGAASYQATRMSPRNGHVGAVERCVLDAQCRADAVGPGDRERIDDADEVDVATFERFGQARVEADVGAPRAPCETERRDREKTQVRATQRQRCR